MDDLIRRLESAGEGSRELDAEIEIGLLPAFLVTKDRNGYVQINRKGTALTPIWEDFDPYGTPHYTTSIDAALTLLPGGAIGAGSALWSVADMEEGPIARIIRCMPDGSYVGGLTEGFAAAPALALCAAALKARKEE